MMKYLETLGDPSRFKTPLAFNPKTGRPVYLIGGGSQMLEEIPPAPANNPPAPTERTFTADDLQKARQEEKDKVYSRLEQEAAQRKALEDEVAKLRIAQQEREAAEAAARQQAEEAARLKAESEMSAKDLLAQREREIQERLSQATTEWEQKFQQMQQEREQEKALLEKERELAALQAYTQKRVAEERDNIAPQLLDFIQGNTPEQIEHSIESVKAKSQEIANAAREAIAAQRASQRGVAPTGYAPVGPMEIEGGTRQYSPEDIQNMDMQEYAKFRQQIPGLATNHNRGLYG
jgi:uncharacterized membrane protein YqiK